MSEASDREENINIFQQICFSSWWRWLKAYFLSFFPSSKTKLRFSKFTKCGAACASGSSVLLCIKQKLIDKMNVFAVWVNTGGHMVCGETRQRECTSQTLQLFLLCLSLWHRFSQTSKCFTVALFALVSHPKSALPPERRRVFATNLINHDWSALRSQHGLLRFFCWVYDNVQQLKVAYETEIRT